VPAPADLPLGAGDLLAVVVDVEVVAGEAFTPAVLPGGVAPERPGDGDLVVTCGLCKVGQGGVAAVDNTARASTSSSRAITRRSSSISAASNTAANRATSSRSPSTRTRAAVSRSSRIPRTDAIAHPLLMERKQDAKSLPHSELHHA
jgi:hypothetical protein